MSVIVLGLNHRTVPLELLERMAVAPERLPKVLHDLCARENVTEGVVLSTCNRTEFYVLAERFHGGVQDVRNALCDLSSLPPEDFTDGTYTFHDTAAVAHLFHVAAGLDSAVLGESEILGQVRNAWEVAAAEGAAGPTLGILFRHAVEVGKRVRTHTGIARHTASVPSAAVALAAERLGTLDGRRVLVLGAGEVGERLALALAGSGAVDVSVANRTGDRAEDLAARVGGRAVPMSRLSAALTEVDLLLSSTGASEVMVGHADLEPALAARNGRELLIVDVAMPRDVDPGAADLPGVTLLDMDDIRAFADAGLAERRSEVSRVRDLIDEEVSRYRAVLSARDAAPLVTALRRRVEEARAAEVERLGRRLGPAEREAVDAATRAVVAKVLHDPTVRLKETSGSVRGERLAEALRELFDLP